MFSYVLKLLQLYVRLKLFSHCFFLHKKKFKLSFSTYLFYMIPIFQHVFNIFTTHHFKFQKLFLMNFYIVTFDRKLFSLDTMLNKSMTFTTREQNSKRRYILIQTSNLLLIL